MSQTPGDTLHLCDVTPSDMAGSIDNIFMRLNNLEQIVARMLGVDVSALQLSDITDNGGILQNITQIYNTTTGIIHGMDYDTGLPMPNDGRNYYPIFNTVLVDGILVYKIVAWLPVTGNGTNISMAYATRYYNNGIANLDDSKSEGITFSDVSSGGMIVMEVDVPANGFYAAGVSTNGHGGLTNGYTLAQVIGMHGTDLAGPYDYGAGRATSDGGACSVTDMDYLPQGTTLQFYSHEVSNGSAQNAASSYFWIVQLA